MVPAAVGMGQQHAARAERAKDGLDPVFAGKRAGTCGDLFKTVAFDVACIAKLGQVGGQQAGIGIGAEIAKNRVDNEKLAGIL